MTTTVDDPRVCRSKAAIVDAAVELLTESGIDAVTIEAIAARSGVAKTTIYRHWPDRSALVRDIVPVLASCEPIPDSGDLRTDLITSMVSLNRRLHQGRYGKALPALIARAEHDPEVAAALDAHIAERRSMLAARLRAARAGGDLADGVDADHVQTSLVGAVFYRRLLLRKPLRRAEIERLVRLALTSPAAG